jgi:hypothetical protein
VTAQVEGVEVAGSVFGGGERGGSPGSYGLGFFGLGFLGWNLAGGGLVMSCGGDEVTITGITKSQAFYKRRLLQPRI